LFLYADFLLLMGVDVQKEQVNVLKRRLMLQEFDVHYQSLVNQALTHNISLYLFEDQVWLLAKCAILKYCVQKS
jgi:hypothetical protein